MEQSEIEHGVHTMAALSSTVFPVSGQFLIFISMCNQLVRFQSWKGHMFHRHSGHMVSLLVPLLCDYKMKPATVCVCVSNYQFCNLLIIMSYTFQSWEQENNQLLMFMSDCRASNVDVTASSQVVLIVSSPKVCEGKLCLK